MNDPPVLVLALVRDLMFASRISATARALRIDAKILRDPAQLANLPGRLLMVDLNQEGVLPAVVEWKLATGMPVIGFVSHVDTATIERARQAGVERVMARSRFVEMLPELLKQEGSPP